MITLCTNCNINWARLKDVEGDGDETYAVCPLCNTDWHLQEGTDIVGHIYCQITGTVVSVGKGIVPEKQAAPKVEPVKKLVWDETIEQFYARQDKAEDEWLEKKLAGTVSAKEQVTRKFHYE